ncbi:MAG: hypothetical protein U0795_24725 [Pirellulales bacterium]
MIAPIEYEYEYEYRDAEYEYEEFNRRTSSLQNPAFPGLCRVLHNPGPYGDYLAGQGPKQGDFLQLEDHAPPLAGQGKVEYAESRED